ncbi:hypothetical protein ZEAMMB73_Zm00001d051596 [Zea mays]|jgi:hypothetical protein|uniref:Uncharacterized protein n=1 Tax=Zea mays TaxID=4577 RepID=K7U7Q1_MAIZE|nr:hypothetical protein ZEAMMB73_Zm00001d051596 [Zea mays]
MAASSTSAPTMPAMVTPLPGYGYQGSAAGAGAGGEPLYSSSGSSSMGTFFGVLVAVVVLTLLSCVFGRVCAGHAEGPDERYDCTRLAPRWWCGWRRAPRRTAVKREAKAPPVLELEAPAASPPPGEP